MSEYLIFHISVAFPDQSEHLKNLLEAVKDVIMLAAHSHMHKHCHLPYSLSSLSNVCKVFTSDLCIRITALDSDEETEPGLVLGMLLCQN